MLSEIFQSDSDTIFDPDKSDKFYHEINLLRLEGYCFNFSRRRTGDYKKKGVEVFKDKVKTPNGVKEFSLTIEPHPSYGKPGVLAYKVLQATIKKYSEYGYPFPNGVYFSFRELIKAVGHSSCSGKTEKELINAIKQLDSTSLECFFFIKEGAGNGEWKRVRFKLFGPSMFSGRGATLEKCFFYLDPVIIQNLNNKYTFCLNYSRMLALEPISSALFKRLFFYFSAIYSSKKSKNFFYTKNYQDVCSWLGGLKVYTFKADIKKQFDSHFKALRETNIISKLPDIEKNVQGDGFNIKFFPGKGFFDDYDHFYIKDSQLELPFKQISEKRLVEEPMLLVKHFYQRLYNSKELEDNILSESEIDLASAILNEFQFEEIKEWIDYAINQSKITGFEIKKFGGIKNFKTEFFVKRSQIQKEKEEKKKRAEEKQKIVHQDRLEGEYQAYRQQTADAYEKTLTETEIAKIQTDVEASVIEQHGDQFGFKINVNLEKKKRLVELAGTLSFEEWLTTKK